MNLNHDSNGTSIGTNNSNTSAPEPEFVPPPQEPNGFFPGINPRDYQDMSFKDMNLNVTYQIKMQILKL
jgi:hypothetical protein